MTFSVTHIDGSMEQPDDFSGLSALLDELDDAIAEHGDVADGHETGWTLTVMASSRVVWEHVEDGDEPRHLDGLSRKEILELMEQAASGDVDAVESWSWGSGLRVMSDRYEARGLKLRGSRWRPRSTTYRHPPVARSWGRSPPSRSGRRSL